MRSAKALAEFFGSRTLDIIDSGAVERFKLYRSQQHRKNARDGRRITPAAVNRDLAVLRILFNFSMRLGRARHNPVAGIKFFSEDNWCLRILTAREEEWYLRAASPLLRDVAVLMLDTGMRPGEVCRLRVADVDLQNRSVYVQKGKTTYATRHIALTQRGLEVPAQRTMAAKTEWLFPCPYDPTKPVGEVRRAHEAALRRRGIFPRFRLYDLRHTALSRIAMAGVDLATLKEIAGHSQIQMTMRYIHPTAEHRRKVLEKFETFCADLRRPTVS